MIKVCRDSYKQSKTFIFSVFSVDTPKQTYKNNLIYIYPTIET